MFIGITSLYARCNGTIVEKFIWYTTKVMVPLSEKRHRLHSHEIPEVEEGLRLRLEALLEKKGEPERAEIAFRTLYRLKKTSVGRPKYPEFSWEYLNYYLRFLETRT